jgi:hypothetical protein
MVSGADDKTVKVFKTNDWYLVQDYKEHSHYVYSV